MVDDDRFEYLLEVLQHHHANLNQLSSEQLPERLEIQAAIASTRSELRDYADKKQGLGSQWAERAARKNQISREPTEAEALASIVSPNWN